MGIGLMTYFVTADTRSGEETKRTKTPTMALAWARELHERGATKIRISDEERTYSEAELEELIRARRD
jgi:hypothetical protein